MGDLCPAEIPNCSWRLQQNGVLRWKNSGPLPGNRKQGPTQERVHRLHRRGYVLVGQAFTPGQGARSSSDQSPRSSSAIGAHQKNTKKTRKSIFLEKSQYVKKVAVSEPYVVFKSGPGERASLKNKNCR